MTVGWRGDEVSGVVMEEMTGVLSWSYFERPTREI